MYYGRGIQPKHALVTLLSTQAHSCQQSNGASFKGVSLKCVPGRFGKILSIDALAVRE